MNASHYFGAGPAALPQEVKQQIKKAVDQYEDLPVSILELSHRSDEFAVILEDARNLIRSLYSVPDNYHLLFMQGGATLQFDAVPLNLLGMSKHATYIDTGLWSRRAAGFAQKHIQVDLVNGLKEIDNNKCLLTEDAWNINSRAAYLYLTPNETVDGIALPEVGHFEIPVVADMTSCFMMRPVDVSRYGIIFAATQKTLGISGLTLVIVREDLLDLAAKDTPYLLRYDEHVRENSIVNTSSVFACYVCKLMLEWVDRQGGIEEMIKQAQQRASLLYSAVDNSEVWFNSICDSSRSTINVVFDCAQKQTLELFFNEVKQLKLTGLEGHRLKGGVRASMYNGTPLAAVEKLSELIREIS